MLFRRKLGPTPTDGRSVAGAAIELMHLGIYHDRVADIRLSEISPSDNTRWTSNFAILAGDHRFATALTAPAAGTPRPSRSSPRRVSWPSVEADARDPGPRSHIDITIESITFRVVHEKTGSHRSIRQLWHSRRRRRADPPRSALGRMIGAAFEISRDIIAIFQTPLAPSGADLANHRWPPMPYALREQTPDTGRLRELGWLDHPRRPRRRSSSHCCVTGRGKAKNVPPMPHRRGAPLMLA